MMVKRYVYYLSSNHTGGPALTGSDPRPEAREVRIAELAVAWSACVPWQGLDCANVPGFVMAEWAEALERSFARYVASPPPIRKMSRVERDRERRKDYARRMRRLEYA